MALDFPNSPTDGQVYDNFYYDAVKGTWKSLSAGSSPSILENPTITNATITDAVITATADTASTVPITVNGAASQSANLQEWKNSAGINLVRIASDGALFSTKEIRTDGKIVGTTQPDAGSDGGVAVRAPASGSQTSAYLQFVNNAYSAQWASIQANSISELNLNASYVKTPQQPSFQGQGSGGQINTNNVQLVFDNQGIPGAHNIGNHYNTSTGVFTAPVAGRYQVSFYMLTNPPNMGNSSVQIMLRYNGTDRYFVAHSHLGSWVVEGMTVIFNMAANDNISFYQYRGTGHYGAYSSLSIRLVG